MFILMQESTLSTSWLTKKMEQLENIARFHREAVLLLLYREAGTVSTLLFQQRQIKITVHTFI